MSRIVHIMFLVFVIAYSFIKFNAVPDLMGQTSYMLTTAVLVILTASLPYVVSIFALSAVKGVGEYILATILPFVAGLLGLAAYVELFIPADIPVLTILPRGIVPGLILSGLVLLFVILKRRESDAGLPA